MTDTPWTPGPWIFDRYGAIMASGNPLTLHGRTKRAMANRAVLAAAPEMADELATAAGIFEHYAQLHYAKNTEDGDEKGDANKAHAVRIRTLLARIKGDAA